MSTSTSETFPQIAYPIRILVPIVYATISTFALIGNLLNFYSLCVSSDRYGRKSLHVLIWNLTVEGSLWTSIFVLVKLVSFADLGEHFASNGGRWLNDSWCKAEMYLLRSMDFLLAYTIVCLCLDRCVRRKVCCFGFRRFVTGICLVLSLWLAISYALIPILFFDQQLISFQYGSYECLTNETQINQLTWLDLQRIQTPYRTIYLLDFIFGNGLPIFLMLFFLLLRFCIYRKATKTSSETDLNTYKQLDLSHYDDEHPNLTKMVRRIAFGPSIRSNERIQFLSSLGLSLRSRLHRLSTSILSLSVNSNLSSVDRIELALDESSLCGRHSAD